MKSFSQWLAARLMKEADQSAYTGQLKGRPAGGSFSANRSQLWGPSATYGRADQRTPADWGRQIPQAWLSAYGSSLRKRVGIDIDTIPNLEPFPTNEKTTDLAVVMPLQLPPEEYMGVITRGNVRGKLMMIRQLVGQCYGSGPQARQAAGVSINYMQQNQGSDEQNEMQELQCGFSFPDLGDHEQMQRAEMFTKLLMQHFAIESLIDNGIANTLDLYTPKVSDHYGEETEWSDEEGNKIEVQYMEAIFQFNLRDNTGWGKQQQQTADQAAKDRITRQDLDSLYPLPEDEPEQ